MVPWCVALPVSPAATTATTIVALCTSMPTNRVDWSMTRLLCLRLHTRPSGVTLDHRHMTRRVTPSGQETDMRSCPGGALVPGVDPVMRTDRSEEHTSEL